MTQTLPGIGDTTWELGVLPADWNTPHELQATRFLAFDHEDAERYVEAHLKPAGFIEYLRPVKD